MNNQNEEIDLSGDNLAEVILNNFFGNQNVVSGKVTLAPALQLIFFNQEAITLSSGLGVDLDLVRKPTGCLDLNYSAFLDPYFQIKAVIDTLLFDAEIKARVNFGLINCPSGWKCEGTEDDIYCLDISPPGMPDFNFQTGYEAINILWDDPSDSDFESLEIECDQCPQNTYVIPAGTEELYIEGLIPGETYSFQFTTVDANGNRSTPPGAFSINTVESLSEVENLSIIPGDGEVELSWVRPVHPFMEGVRVIRNATGSFSSPYDGDLLCDPCHSDAYTDTSVVNGETYYYRVYVYDQEATFGPYVDVYGTPSANTFSIGGFVHLNGASSLTVENGSDFETLTSNGTYAFTVNDGDSYNISFTDPSGYTCEFDSNNESGTANGNVSNIDITCTADAPGTYSIGGDVHLNGASSLTVENGFDSEILTSNGSYAFTVNDGDSYEISFNNPSGYTCEFDSNNESGTANGNINDIDINCVEDFTPPPPPAGCPAGGCNTITVSGFGPNTKIDIAGSGGSDDASCLNDSPGMVNASGEICQCTLDGLNNNQDIVIAGSGGAESVQCKNDNSASFSNGGVCQCTLDGLNNNQDIVIAGSGVAESVQCKNDNSASFSNGGVSQCILDGLNDNQNIVIAGSGGAESAQCKNDNSASFSNGGVSQCILDGLFNQTFDNASGDSVSCENGFPATFSGGYVTSCTES